MKLDNRIWALITAIVVIALLAGGWFLGVSPQLERAATAALNEQGVDSQNQIAQAELAKLAADKKNEKTLDDELSKLQQQIPVTSEDPSFLRDIQALASRYKVTITDYERGDTTPYIAPAAAAPADATTSDSSATDTAAAAPVSADPVPLTDPLVTSESLVTVPVTVAASGSYTDLTRFQNALQDMTRLYLVTGVTVKQNEASSGGGAYVFTSVGVTYVSTGMIAKSDDATSN